MQRDEEVLIRVQHEVNRGKPQKNAKREILQGRPSSSVTLLASEELEFCTWMLVSLQRLIKSLTIQPLLLLGAGLPSSPDSKHPGFHPPPSLLPQATHLLHTLGRQLCPTFLVFMTSSELLGKCMPYYRVKLPDCSALQLPLRLPLSQHQH